MTTSHRFDSYTSGEGRTGIRQAVEFTCPTGNVEKIKSFLAEHVRTINIPTTRRVTIAYGGYGRETRYDVTQHKYAAGYGSIEVLEIKNAPDGRSGVVIYDNCRHMRGACFTEWVSLEEACAAFEQVWGAPKHTEELYKPFAGFKRFVICGALTPWFYAIGDEQLVGDYAFPEGLQDDAVYRYGRQFVVFDYDGVPFVKTCMGTRHLKERHAYASGHTIGFSRIVYWGDGTSWDERQGHGRYGPPVPADEGEAWIVEAVQQFRRLLAGKAAELTINFTDGNKFVGRVVQPKHKNPCAAGDYRLLVKIVGEEETREGWVNGFSPTPEASDPIQFARMKYAEKGQQLEFAEIKEVRNERGGKKWSGVFYRRATT